MDDDIPLQAEVCFKTLMQGDGDLMGLSALKAAARMAGISSEAVGDRTFKQVLRRHAGSSGGEVSAFVTAGV